MKKLIPLKISALVLAVMSSLGNYHFIRFRIIDSVPWKFFPTPFCITNGLIIYPFFRLSSEFAQTDGYYLLLRLITYAMILFWLILVTLIPKKAKWRKVALIVYTVLLSYEGICSFRTKCYTLLWDFALVAITILILVLEKKDADVKSLNKSPH
ncbi:MAG: hypothetical protein J5563_04530 [Clostridia bacterium]|nr:hypothetical protein [Clostridia bacterium]